MMKCLFYQLYSDFEMSKNEELEMIDDCKKKRKEKKNEWFEIDKQSKIKAFVPHRKQTLKRLANEFACNSNW